ncbi:hypothetical protein NDU88_003820 [Pleurodeles waltl]|uniref:Uncharacterized protein n=1 Tax=Pleurodeles waltl TaxID=8319 RepID=A0AAV7W8K6_PLEWA|nr:hypothetical protein NDU88_003820 [Pleurodeles waltl]
MFVPSLANMDTNGESWRVMIAAGGDGAYRRGTYPHQRRPEEGTLACHHQGGADPGGLQPAEHQLSKEVGGTVALGAKDQ